MYMQLLLLGQNVCEVNRERSRLAAASSMFDSTKHNGLVTICIKGTKKSGIQTVTLVKTMLIFFFRLAPAIFDEGAAESRPSIIWRNQNSKTRSKKHHIGRWKIR